MTQINDAVRELLEAIDTARRTRPEINRAAMLGGLFVGAAHEEHWTLDDICSFCRVALATTATIADGDDGNDNGNSGNRQAR